VLVRRFLVVIGFCGRFHWSMDLMAHLLRMAFHRQGMELSSREVQSSASTKISRGYRFLWSFSLVYGFNGTPLKCMFRTSPS
jgi:hypothetical protein